MHDCCKSWFFSFWLTIIIFVFFFCPVTIANASDTGRTRWVSHDSRRDSRILCPPAWQSPAKGQSTTSKFRLWKFISWKLIPLYVASSKFLELANFISESAAMFCGGRFFAAVFPWHLETIDYSKVCGPVMDTFTSAYTFGHWLRSQIVPSGEQLWIETIAKIGVWNAKVGRCQSKDFPCFIEQSHRPCHLC